MTRLSSFPTELGRRRVKEIMRPKIRRHHHYFSLELQQTPASARAVFKGHPVPRHSSQTLEAIPKSSAALLRSGAPTTMNNFGTGWGRMSTSERQNRLLHRSREKVKLHYHIILHYNAYKKGSRSQTPQIMSYNFVHKLMLLWSKIVSSVCIKHSLHRILCK